jgi:hypothetical protein
MVRALDIGKMVEISEGFTLIELMNR